MKDTPFRRQLKLRKGVRYEFGASAVPGTSTIAAVHEDCAVPLATIWFRRNGNHCVEIMSMYTIDHCRKCGLQDWLFDRLLSHMDDTKRVLTAAATRYSRPWLEHRGFKRNADLDLELVVKRKDGK
jgi:hypothetical protein